jgi:sulfur carrier protein ThiS
MALVTYSPNPLTPKKGQVIKEYANRIQVKDVIDDLGAHEREMLVCINGVTPEDIDLELWLEEDDKITITTVVGGSEDAPKILSGLLLVTGILLTATGVGGSIGVNLIVAGATGLVGSIITRLTTPDAAVARTPRSVAASPTYSLNAATNPARPFESLPVVLSGRGHRTYPDYGSNPYGGFDVYEDVTFPIPGWVADGTEPAQISIATLHANRTVNVAAYPFTVAYASQYSMPDGNRFTTVFTLTYYEFPSSIFSSNTFPYNFTSNGADRSNAVNAGETCLWTRARFADFEPIYFVDPADPLNGRFTTVSIWNAWVDAGAVGTPQSFAAPTTINVPIDCWRNSGSTYSRKHAKLYHIFNFGFGDLEITDHRFANTQLDGTTDSYLNVLITDVFKTQTNWNLVPTPIAPVAPNNEQNYEFLAANINAAPFENVDTVEGGLLQNNRGTGPGAIFGVATAIPVTDQTEQNWIHREGAGDEPVFMIEMDIEGRLFQQSPEFGVVDVTRNYQFQYREVGTVNWNIFPGTTLTYQLTGFDTATYRKTLNSGQLPPAKYEVRFRRQSKDENRPQFISDLSVTSIRFFQENISNYVGENRRGVEITASGQINGNINRYSAYVRNKCWVYDPITDAYTWDYSSNPADLFLYFARGGFYNESAFGVFAYPFSPTFGWVNSADHPDNKERMFGAGLQDNRIDFDSLKRWWVFCDTNNLYFDAVLNSQYTCFEILSAIGLAGRASPTWQTGSLGVIIEDRDDQPVAMFGMNNIKKGTFSIGYQNENLADEIIGQYIDREQEWDSHEVRALMPGVRSSLNQVRVSLFGITDQANAQREVNLQAARQYYSRRTISFETDFEGLCVSRGDVILVQHDLTQWDSSGRVTSISHDGTNITSFTLTCAVDAGNTHAMVRMPDGRLESFEVAVAGNTITITDPVNTWALQDGPAYINAELDENLISSFANSQPEDWMVHIGLTETPGKRCRINTIQPTGNNSVRIDCIDEEQAIYAREFDDLPDDLPWEPETDYTKIVARAFNPCVEQLGSGSVCVSWETDGAVGVEVYATIGSMPEMQLLNNGTGSHFGSSLKYDFATGDSVNLRIVPYTTGTPFSSEEATIGFTVE